MKHKQTQGAEGSAPFKKKKEISSDSTLPSPNMSIDKSSKSVHSDKIKKLSKKLTDENVKHRVDEKNGKIIVYGEE